MKHLTNEINRIAQTTGYPLSRASSAGQWIYQSIIDLVSEETLTYTVNEYKKIPIIVIEKIKQRKNILKYIVS